MVPGKGSPSQLFPPLCPQESLSTHHSHQHRNVPISVTALQLTCNKIHPPWVYRTEFCQGMQPCTAFLLPKMYPHILHNQIHPFPSSPRWHLICFVCISKFHLLQNFKDGIIRYILWSGYFQAYVWDSSPLFDHEPIPFYCWVVFQRKNHSNFKTEGKEDGTDKNTEKSSSV